MLWINNISSNAELHKYFLLTLLSFRFQGVRGGEGDLLELEAYVYQGDLLSKATLICD